MATFLVFALCCAVVVNCWLLVRVLKTLSDFQKAATPVDEKSPEPSFVVVEPRSQDYIPDPWVTRAVKQSNDWKDPQDRADELAALREKMKLSRYHS